MATVAQLETMIVDAVRFALHIEEAGATGGSPFTTDETTRTKSG